MLNFYSSIIWLSLKEQSDTNKVFDSDSVEWILTLRSEFWLCGVNSDSAEWNLILRSAFYSEASFTPLSCFEKLFSTCPRSGDTEFFFYSNILAKSKPKSKMNCLSPKMGSSNEKYMIVNNLPFNVWEPKIASRKRREIIHIVRRREIILYT